MFDHWTYKKQIGYCVNVAIEDAARNTAIGLTLLLHTNNWNLLKFTSLASSHLPD
jgi:hypothetical protein